MQKGGRMTYGFGFWRSGFSTLIPWHWRWIPYRKDHFDYLGNPKYSGTGQKMDEQGNIIPAIYWECLREGYDDARYLYTLEQALSNRRDTLDSKCRELVAKGQKLIQKLWDSTPPQATYHRGNLWADGQFTVNRWRMAQLIEALLQYPATNTGQAPSVMADTSKPLTKAPNAFEIASQKGALKKINLSESKFSHWKTVGNEVRSGEQI